MQRPHQEREDLHINKTKQNHAGSLAASFSSNYQAPTKRNDLQQSDVINDRDKKKDAESGDMS